jgi:hypothetical protein
MMLMLMLMLMLMMMMMIAFIQRPVHSAAASRTAVC